MVSIIVPIYNTSRYIEKCVRSLLEQTYRDYEIIFIDDGCTDGSILLLKKLLDEYELPADRVKILAHDTTQGSSSARSTGMKAAQGDYMIQIDSDDYVAPDFLEKMMARATECDADIVVCDYYTVEKNNTLTLRQVQLPTDKNECVSMLLSGLIHNALWNKLIRCSLYRDNNIYPLEGISMFDDKSIMYKLFYYANRIEYLPEALYYYNKTNPFSITAQNKALAIEPAMRFIADADEFMANHEVDDQILLGYEYFKISIRGVILLYANREHMLAALPLTQRSTLHKIINQPLIPFYYKWILVFDKLHMKFMCKTFRYCLNKIAMALH